MATRFLLSLLTLIALSVAASSTPRREGSVESRWTGDDAASGTSALESTGLVRRAPGLDFSRSNWIWTNDVAAGAAPVGARAFRKAFTAPLGKTPVSAEILITADNVFTLYVNGAQVGTGPDYRYAERFCVALYPCLNVFAVTAVNAATVPNPAGLLVSIQILYQDGTTSTIVSDTTWRASIPVPNGFEQLSFDDSSWAPAIAEGAHGVSPWGRIGNPADPPAFSLQGVSWIWTNEVVNGNAPPGPRAFRRTYIPPPGQIPTSANIIIAADNEYSLYVNGVLVGSGTNFNVAQRYVVNLAPAPSVVLAVYAVNTAAVNNPAGLIVVAEIDSTSSECNCTSGALLVTPQGWKANTGTPIGFQLPDYDDSSWPAATVEGVYGSAPWGNIAVSSAMAPPTALQGAPASAQTAA
ncbi:lectin [Mycena rebaudengoi]|nr:lectin [Mycena rebaudengoi]